MDWGNPNDIIWRWVIYGRVEHPDGNYETLIVTKPEFRQYMSGPEVKEFR